MNPRCVMFSRKKIRQRLFVFFSVMGPGIITAFGNNDAAGITTYSVVGARSEFSFVWVMVPLAVSIAFIQDMCARMAMATGKGLSDLIREEFGLRLAFLCMACLLVSNYTTIVAEFAGIASAFEMFGVVKFISVPVCAFLVWAMVLKGSFKFAEKFFLFLSATLVSYIVCTFLLSPPWETILSKTVKPHVKGVLMHPYLFLGLVGTTVTPWMQFFIQGNLVDKGITKEQYKYVRLDVIVGTIVATLTAYFIIVCTAVTLFPKGIHISEAAHAALALERLAGERAHWLFATGLLGGSLLGAAILPLSTAYAFSEAFGMESGISKRFEEARAFFLIYTVLVFLGACPVLFPEFPQVAAMIFSQVLQGIFLPVLIVYILLLCNKKKLMGEHRNTFADNMVGVVTAVSVSIVTLLFLKSFMHG